MTRTISYDTENSDDILWALKRVVEDMYGHNNHALEMLHHKNHKLQSY